MQIDNQLPDQFEIPFQRKKFFYYFFSHYVAIHYEGNHRENFSSVDFFLRYSSEQNKQVFLLPRFRV